MLAGLDQILLGQARHEFVLSLLEGHAVHGERAFDDFIEGRWLIRIFTVTQAHLFAADVPGLLGVADGLFAHGQGQVGGKESRFRV
jgi:hypothetical protein